MKILQTVTIVDMSNTSSKYLYAIDEAMKHPESRNRGEQIAALSNYLDVQNDSAMHFGLGYSFKKIKKTKDKSI